ncbi:tripartite tricarboxylate transporter TctB family protein [uncultured Variovorax sp.]|uniref:tripartite tricarboxylate transporter TctB family protein n=1 Tax=uncultured Variovorax sp. TaxID=114708 RepID=UPI0025CE2BDE|nr:tripartite tricarboxylate transporter TctB family protein [uncultured Variovorax sp.]
MPSNTRPLPRIARAIRIAPVRHAQARSATNAAGGMRIDRIAEFLCGAAFSAFGLSFACGARGFDIGSGAQLGPFYLPVLAGLLIALAGNLVILMSLSPWRSGSGPAGGTAATLLAILAILGSSLGFASALGGLSAVGVPTVGLPAGIYLTVFTAWLATGEGRPRRLAALAAALAFGSWMGFAVALDVPLPLWPTFLQG